MRPFFNRFATVTSIAAGQPLTFAIAVMIVLVWAVTGPMFRYSDTWQLVINTGTTIVTFLMVFLIQNSQNRDGSAMQAKLDELLRAALERHALELPGKQKTAGDTVDRLLNRMTGPTP